LGVENNFDAFGLRKLEKLGFARVEDGNLAIEVAVEREEEYLCLGVLVLDFSKGLGSFELILIFRFGFIYRRFGMSGLYNMVKGMFFYCFK